MKPVISEWRFPLDMDVLGITNDSDSYKNIDITKQVEIPFFPHCGSFGIRRKYDHHEGVDLYCPENTPVYAVEDGDIVIMRVFTGKYAHCGWWNETDSITVEGETGAVEYGEIKINPDLRMRDHVKKGDLLGHVRTVLKKDKGRPMSMLHMQLYIGAQTRDKSWELDGEKPFGLEDPTPHLIKAMETRKEFLKTLDELDEKIPDNFGIILGPENHQKEAAECLMSAFNDEEEGDVKYIELSQVRKESQPGIIFNWGIDGVGFGQYTLFTEKEKIGLDTECTSKETFLKVMGYLYDQYAE